MNPRVLSVEARGEVRAFAPRDLHSLLRHATAQAHQDLETSLALLSQPLQAARFRHVLARFFGFHQGWVQALAAFPHAAAFAQSRSRLPHLRRDLAALGLTNAEVGALPVCRAATDSLESEAEAVGSLYVMEGSTLGGQVIARALAAEAWAPTGGFAYFNPYGAATGAQWRAFRLWAEAQVAPGDELAAVEGARRTFRLLQAWTAA